MVLNKLMGLFGKKESEPESPLATNQKASSGSAISDIEHFVDYVVRILVDKPESIRTDIEKSEDGLNIIRIYCEQDDIGKIIGKNGKTITAIRTLASNAGVRAGFKLTVELAEQK